MTKKAWSTLGWIGVALIALIALSEGWFGHLIGRFLGFLLLAVVAFVVLFPIGYFIGKQRTKSDQKAIADSGEDLLGTLTDMKASGKSYVECMEYLRRKGIGKSTAENLVARAVETLNSRLTVKDNPPDPGKRTTLERFLEETYRQWNAGACAALSDAFLAETRTNSAEKFIATYTQMLGRIAEACFQSAPPQSDEILVGFVEDGFLLTNKRLYIFHKRCPEPRPRTLYCQDIRDYSVQGTLTFTLNITLASGEVLAMNKLDRVINKNYMQHLIHA